MASQVIPSLVIPAVASTSSISVGKESVERPLGTREGISFVATPKCFYSHQIKIWVMLILIHTTFNQLHRTCWPEEPVGVFETQDHLYFILHQQWNWQFFLCPVFWNQNRTFNFPVLLTLFPLTCIFFAGAPSLLFTTCTLRSCTSPHPQVKICSHCNTQFNGKIQIYNLYIS